MPDEGQAEGVLGLAGGEPGGGFDHAGQLVAAGKLAVLGGHSASDLIELGTPGQIVIDDGEELVQLRRDLNTGASTITMHRLVLPAWICRARAWMISVAPRNLSRLSKTTSVVPDPLATCGSARMTARGSWASVTPGIWIGSSGNVMPRSQSQTPSRQPSSRHRVVRSRVASVGSFVCTHKPGEAGGDEFAETRG
jgi:hypothetical protein